jgi:hypothetical protein
MGDIAKSLLTGAWTLVVGWILPTALNTAVFLFAVAPSLPATGSIGHARHAMRSNTGLILLAASVLLGLALNAVQNPLYRVLEGYLLWPAKAYESGCTRHLQKHQDLKNRLTLMRLEGQQRTRHLSPAEARTLRSLQFDPRIRKDARKDRRHTRNPRSGAIYRALLREKRDRYPAEETEFAPSTLGNAIRRFEVYGRDRFHLDSQLLWDELTGTAPDHIQRQVDVSRANVDFFIALLYGHLLVAVTAAATLASAHADRPLLLVTIAALGSLACAWYRAAVVATDQWAASVRALVNVGRKPLADSLGLVLPQALDDERAMWKLVNEMSRRPYSTRLNDLDRYRAQPPAPNP